MKILIALYSRTGVTRKVAGLIGKELSKSYKSGQCDIEEITDKVKRDGAIGCLRCGREATLKKIPAIDTPKNNPSNYDLVIIGTPIWAFTMASPVRAYLTSMKSKFKKVAFFCTQGGSGAERAFEHMQELCGKKPIAKLTLSTNEVMKEDCKNKVERFVKSLNKK